jgi:prophage tail gpP-like protein
MSDPGGGTATTTLDDLNVTAPAISPTINAPPAAPLGGDDLILTIDGVDWTGWTTVQLTRSMDTIPANFHIALTEKYPNKPDISVRPGSACTIKLGGDLVLTGYVDRYDVGINARDHTVLIAGRSKSGDLVDCAAFVGSHDNEHYALRGSPISIIRQLAQAYGIQVQTSGVDDTDPQVPQGYQVNLGETAWEIIDRLAKAAQVVVYDAPDGSIILARAGDEAMASGFIQGVNVESAGVTFTMDQRFSHYFGFQMSTLTLTKETADEGGTQKPDVQVRDEGVPRFRKRIVINDLVDAQGSMLQRLVEWEKNRRNGRSYAVTVTCDSWRDSAGNLWAPNHRASTNIPAVKIQNVEWTIGQVTYVKDERGRHAIVTMMPRDAFSPQPSPIMPAFPTGETIGTRPNNPTARETDAPPDVNLLGGNF